MKKNIFIWLALCCVPAAAASEGKAYAAARHIRAGEALSADALRELPGPAAETLTAEEVAGSEAARPIRAGETVTRLMLRPARAVRPGDRIKVAIVSGRVRVSAWFTALGGGARGEVIEARNAAGGRTRLVRVEGPGAASLQEEGK